MLTIKESNEQNYEQLFNDNQDSLIAEHGGDRIVSDTALNGYNMLYVYTVLNSFNSLVRDAVMGALADGLYYIYSIKNTGNAWSIELHMDAMYAEDETVKFIDSFDTIDDIDL